jgi:hypothetical protein
MGLDAAGAAVYGKKIVSPRLHLYRYSRGISPFVQLPDVVIIMFS